MEYKLHVPEIIDRGHSFCAGCGHGVFFRLIEECVEELGYKDNHCFVLGVGCSCNIHKATYGDKLQAPHGRASAVSVGMKRIKKDMLVLSYQGDGDASAIGMSETLNAAYRNEKITLFTLNNSNYGMTGGQMSWTTLPGQKTTTTVLGRDCSVTGNPFHLPELVASQFDVAYSARGSVHGVKNIRQLKKYIKNALEAQINGEGYSVVEVIGACPTNWGKTPLDSQKWLEENMTKEFPLGEFKKREVK
jgi:2-oxoglutarate ferredoxin oxidoreductase subunit beta